MSEARSGRKKQLGWEMGLETHLKREQVSGLLGFLISGAQQTMLRTL